MTVVTITFADTEDGCVDVQTIINNFDLGSNAQALANRVNEHIGNIAEEKTLPEDFLKNCAEGIKALPL